MTNQPNKRKAPAAVEKTLQEHDAEVERWTRTIFQFCVLGNAGGVAATLAFAGSLLAESHSAGLIKLPMVFFSFGLVSGGAIAIFEYRRTLNRALQLHRWTRKWESGEETCRPDPAVLRWAGGAFSCAVLSLLAFVLGTITSVLEIVVFL